MKFGIYISNRDETFNHGEIVELHMEMKHRGTKRYLAKKHKKLGVMPYAKVNVPSMIEVEVFTANTFQYYVNNPSNFIWVLEKDVNITDKNTNMKHVLERLED
jgi:hypothetical protein